jgi:hypothetical protein
MQTVWCSALATHALQQLTFDGHTNSGDNAKDNGKCSASTSQHAHKIKP